MNHALFTLGLSIYTVARQKLTFSLHIVASMYWDLCRRHTKCSHYCDRPDISGHTINTSDFRLTNEKEQQLLRKLALSYLLQPRTLKVPTLECSMEAVRQNCF